MEQRVTIWYCWKEDSCEWKFNHIEFGDAEGDRPVPQSERQRVWERREWRKVHGKMVDNCVIENHKMEGCGL